VSNFSARGLVGKKDPVRASLRGRRGIFRPVPVESLLSVVNFSVEIRDAVGDAGVSKLTAK